MNEQDPNAQWIELPSVSTVARLDDPRPGQRHPVPRATDGEKYRWPHAQLGNYGLTEDLSHSGRDVDFHTRIDAEMAKSNPRTPSVEAVIEQERAHEAEQLRSAEALAQANARLRQMSARLVDEQERERAHIARELHDGLGQMLTGIVIQLYAAHASESPERAEECHANALDLALKAIQQVKSMSFQLRPAQLELLGFVAAVKATLDRQRDATGLQSFVRLRCWTPQRVLPAHAVALRILQEALNNVRRHAMATRLVVRLRFDGPDHFVMTIGDDGCGYDVRAVLAGGMSEKNVGLHGMLERAELMGGQLRFRSSVGRGSVVRLSL